MTRQEVIEVLDLVCSLDRRCEESSKGRDQRGKETVKYSVNLNGQNVESLINKWNCIGNLGGENRIWNACEFLLLESEVVEIFHVESDRADKPLLPSRRDSITKKSRKPEGEKSGGNDSTEETLPGLARRHGHELFLDKLASKVHAPNVGRDVVNGHASEGKQYPEYAVENVLCEKLALKSHEHHVDECPHELTELIPNEFRPERVDRKHEENDKKDSRYDPVAFGEAQNCLIEAFVSIESL